MEPHLSQLIPFLFQALQSPKYLVRSITCWTLGRYSRWCLYPTDGTGDPAVYLQPLLAGVSVVGENMFII
jgi:transportin-1